MNCNEKKINFLAIKQREFRAIQSFIKINDIQHKHLINYTLNTEHETPKFISSEHHSSRNTTR
jgi:hypothetical protein